MYDYVTVGTEPKRNETKRNDSLWDYEDYDKTDFKSYSKFFYNNVWNLDYSYFKASQSIIFSHENVFNERIYIRMKRPCPRVIFRVESSRII